MYKQVVTTEQMNQIVEDYLEVTPERAEFIPYQGPRKTEPAPFKELIPDYLNVTDYEPRYSYESNIFYVLEDEKDIHHFFAITDILEGFIEAPRERLPLYDTEKREFFLNDAKNNLEAVERYLQNPDQLVAVMLYETHCYVLYARDMLNDYAKLRSLYVVYSQMVEKELYLVH